MRSIKRSMNTLPSTETLGNLFALMLRIPSGGGFFFEVNGCQNQKRFRSSCLLY